MGSGTTTQDEVKLDTESAIKEMKATRADLDRLLNEMCFEDGLERENTRHGELLTRQRIQELQSKVESSKSVEEYSKVSRKTAETSIFLP